MTNRLHVAPHGSAAQIVDSLGMRPHPEGGWFVETWRAETGAKPGNARPSGSAIYYLLEQHQVSRWHRIDASELWHWYGGAALDLLTYVGPGPSECAVPAASAITTRALGPDLAQAARPQLRVAPGRWQRAITRGAYTLVGCTVSPAFEYESFELAPEGWGT